MNTNDFSTYQDAALTAKSVYDDAAPKGFTQSGETFHDPDSDFQGAIYDKPGGQDAFAAVRGTESVRDAITDANMGAAQSASSAAADMVVEITKMVRAGKNVTITGHSLGAGVAYAIAYEVARITKKSVNVVTFNGIGGRSAIEQFHKERKEMGQPSTTSPEVLSRINGVNFVDPKDVVPGLGIPMGETFTVGPPQTFQERFLDKLANASLPSKLWSMYQKHAMDPLLEKMVALGAVQTVQPYKADTNYAVTWASWLAGNWVEDLGYFAIGDPKRKGAYIDPYADHVNISENYQHMLGLGKLQMELQRAGAPNSLLESLAKGSGATAFNKNGVNPSMGAAMMRGLEGVSVVNDVRFSALDKLAGEHARLEYERTGDVAAATQAGVDAVRAAKEVNTGQAPLSGLSNAQVAEKAVQGYRDYLMQDTLQIDQYGRVTRGSLADKNPNYAGPSHEFSPEDYMTFEQNQQQLARNEAKRLAAKMQREAPKATAKTPPKTPRTVTLNVPRQDYLSGQTQQGAALASNRNIDTTGLNVDLLNIAVPKTRPGQYEVTLGGWSPVMAASAPAAPAQKQAPTYKSDPDLLAAAKRTDQQLAQQARINKAADQVRAREDGLLSEKSKSTRASAKEDTLDDADMVVDKTPGGEAAKADTLGGSVKVHGIELLGENAVSYAASKPSAVDSANVAANRRTKNVNAGNSGGNVNEGSGPTPSTNESLYGPGSAPEGSLGQAGGYDSNGDYHSGTNRNGTSTGGVKTDNYGREIGAYGQFTRDIIGRGNGSEAAGNTRVICTELVRQSLMAPSLQRLDITYTLRHLSPATVRGYHAWAVPYVRLMKRSHLATRLVEPLARWRAEEIAYQMKSRSCPHYPGRVVRWLGEPVCWERCSAGLATRIGFFRSRIQSSFWRSVEAWQGGGA